jgi:hypothetical protein
MILRRHLSKTTNQRGQALTESVIILPIMVFMLFGMWQLMLLQHARVMVEYAAHNACRAGIVNNGDPYPMKQAALISVLPLFGRTDNPRDLGAVYAPMDVLITACGAADAGVDRLAGIIRENFGINIAHFVPSTCFVDVEIQTPTDEMFLLESKDAEEMDFDNVQDPSHMVRNLLSAEVRVLFPLKIPILNQVIYELYMVNAMMERNLSFSREDGKALNQLSTQIAQRTLAIEDGGAPKELTDIAKEIRLPLWKVKRRAEVMMLNCLAYGRDSNVAGCNLPGGAFLVPITATCGMLMQSNVYKDFVNHGAFDTGAVRGLL